MPPIFDPAIFDPVIFDAGAVQPSTACAVGQDQAVQEEQAAAQIKLVAAAAEDQAVQQEQAAAWLQQSVAAAQGQAVQEQQNSAAMLQAMNVAEVQALQEHSASAAMQEALVISQDQAIQEEDADAAVAGGQSTTDCSVAQDQAPQEQDADVSLGAATIPGIIPSAGQYTYVQQPRLLRARAKPAKKGLGLTIPTEWPTKHPSPPQIVTEISVHQEQPPGDEQSQLELGAIWRPFTFTPPVQRSTIGAYQPRRSPQPLRIPAEPRTTLHQSAPARRAQPPRRKASVPADPIEAEEEAIATAVLALFGGPR